MMLLKCIRESTWQKEYYDMATFVYDYIARLDERWTEIDILIEQADNCIESNPNLYNALCRSISILIVSHMEGFIKELVKNVINDVNYNLNFANMPSSMKRTFCCKYLDINNNDLSSKIDSMIADFSCYDQIKISHEPFLFSGNRNPKPSIIKDVLSKFGVSDIFKNLHNSFFDNTFESSSKSSLNLNRLKKILVCVSSTFPYKASIERFNLKKTKYTSRTLWQVFLDNLNQTRHKIVHGNTFDNLDSIQDIKLTRDKVKILQLIITYVLCSKVSEDLAKCNI